VPFAVTVDAAGNVLAATDSLLAEQQTLLAGRQLYVKTCASCHGASGGGDGENTLQGSSIPPDLREHMVPGLHSDGQLYLWSRDGISGTSMPGYGLVLSDVELWQVAAYLRTFGQSDPVVGVDPDALATQQARPPTPTLIPDVAEPLPPLILVRQGNLWQNDDRQTQLTPLTALGTLQFAQNPALSPDGLQLAYLVTSLPTGSENLTSTLVVGDSNGSASRVLLESTQAYLREPRWAPNGNAVYVTQVQDEQLADGSYREQSTILRIDVQSGEQRVVLDGARDLVFSSDGRQIAYVRVSPDGATMTLELADADGRNARVIVDDPNFSAFAAPRFAPDGQRLIVSAIGGPTTDTQGRSQEGEQASPLTALLDGFSPATAEAHGAPWDIWSVARDGSELRRLTAVYEDDPRAVFSPDGREIVFMGFTGIYRMNADGSALRRIDIQGDHGGIDWISSSK
jgi:Tol biopolymer transport system component/mono/diheme cytochrome c family protein